jgi:hypothetical protein
MGFLKSHPEQTAYVLKYLAGVDRPQVLADAEEALVDFIESPDAIYPFQIYQILSWLPTAYASVSAPMLALVHRLAFDTGQPPFVRVVARRILSEHGSGADLERMESVYAACSSDLEQAELICCLQRMERGRRNGFLSRVEHDGELQRRAVQLVRSGSAGRSGSTRSAAS